MIALDCAGYTALRVAFITQKCEIVYTGTTKLGKTADGLTSTKRICACLCHFKAMGIEQRHVFCFKITFSGFPAPGWSLIR
jgi:hypothetical protein